MAEKLCLQWNDFQDNVKTAFGHLRDTTDFVDVTLASEDGQQIEAHKVILAASSPFFQSILKKNKHSHPLIYLKGMKSDDLTAIVDFLYFGEASVYQENFESFLAIAEELQLKGLEGSKDQQESKEAEPLEPKEAYETNSTRLSSITEHIETETTYEHNKTGSNALALPKTSVFSANLQVRLRNLATSNLQELDDTIKTMMETSENMIKVGKKQRRAKICKVCGKEGYSSDIKRHVEANHLEGVSVPCNLCDKILRWRHD